MVNLIQVINEATMLLYATATMAVVSRCLSCFSVLEITLAGQILVREVRPRASPDGREHVVNIAVEFGKP